MGTSLAGSGETEATGLGGAGALVPGNVVAAADAALGDSAAWVGGAVVGAVVTCALVDVGGCVGTLVGLGVGLGGSGVAVGGTGVAVGGTGVGVAARGDGVGGCAVGPAVAVGLAAARARLGVSGRSSASAASAADSARRRAAAGEPIGRQPTIGSGRRDSSGCAHARAEPRL
ncbi:MAG: hypothetical protein JO023_28125 [Chloroflexi bacterium]|nr:hypothetical protein [Chloroflexota bacterium]